MLGNGVRQGGILSPLLFNFYLNDVIVRIKKLKFGCRLGCQMLNMLCYADDMVLIAPTTAGLQHLMNIVNDEITNLDLIINSSKTCCMSFRPKIFLKNRNPKFFIGDHQIESVKSHEYLGIMISNDLTNKLEII